MTVAWRICREPFADLSGDGARLYGGRWNSPGQAVVYMAETAALAVLEVRVHLDLPPHLLPVDYVLTCISLTGLPVESLDSIPDRPRAVGDAWLRQHRSPVLSVRSLIVPESRNLLLNPAHKLAPQAQIVSIRPFAFDPRLWAPQ